MNDRRDRSLPTYSESVMIQFPTAPLLDETFTPNIFGTARTLKFEFNSGDSFDYSFLVRDSDGTLQAKGDVKGHITILTGITGREVLKIIKRESFNVNETITNTFEIRHKNVEIGTVKVAAEAPAANCLQIFHKDDSPQLVVRSLKVGDFAIFRGRSSSIPVCSIQLLNTGVYTFGEFSGTIIFEPGITTQEQLLCTSAAIAFKVITKQVTKATNEKGKCEHRCAAACCCFIFIVILVISFILLDKWSCDYKKSKGWAGYSGRQC